MRRGGFPAGILATRDGRRFRTVARLPVPAFYAAAATVGSRVWLFGGRTAAGPTDVIQQVDLRTGAARVVGRLPYRLTGAAAFALDGTIYLAGGRTAAAAAPAAPLRRLRRLRRPVADPLRPGSPARPCFVTNLTAAASPWPGSCRYR